EVQEGEVDRVVERKAADTAGELVGAAIELERRGTAGVGERHLAGDRAAAAECERAGRDCGAAGVVVCSRHSQDAAADFNKGTGPENGAGESRGIGRTSGESIAAECDKAAGTGQGADRLIITGEIEQAAIDGDVAVGWQTSARAKLQCTRQNRRAAGVILGCREDGRASADLRESAGAG